ncbi:MAG: sensor histidine kinase [Methermicoccaceae archaeon]
MLIINYASLLKDDLPEGSEDREMIDELEEASRRISYMVKCLQEFSSYELSGWEGVAVGELIDTALSLLAYDVRHSMVRVEKDIEDVTFTCRREEVVHLIASLITNAIDALDEKYPSSDDNKLLRVSAHRSGDDVVIQVYDRGMGMDEALMNKIFEPLSTTKGSKRTGLGLMVVYDIVKMHHGNISVISKKGEGTTFTIKLPISYGGKK